MYISVWIMQTFYCPSQGASLYISLLNIWDSARLCCIMFPKRCDRDRLGGLINVLIWYTSIFCGKVLSDETRMSRPPFSFSSRCFTRMVRLPSCRNTFSPLEVLWKSWSTHWYLLLYSVTDITPQNRDCCREMDATTLTYLIKINEHCCLCNSLFLVLLGAFVVEHFKVIHTCHWLFSVSSLLILVNVAILIFPQRWILLLFFKAWEKRAQVFLN